MKPVSVVEKMAQDIRYRDRIIVALCVALSLLGIALVRIPTKISVYHPPDLSQSGQISRIGEVPPSTVYAFATLFLERIQYCKDDCANETPATLMATKAFLTPACFNQLKDHFENNKGLYAHRTRSIQPRDNTGFTLDKVIQLDSKTWQVTEEFYVDERVKGTAYRDLLMRYPLRIVKSNASTQFNPYQLQLDCYASQPTRIEADSKK